ncbi:hypothetical protein FVEG_07637 [Fusarium verticillioides 7600]|uniref:Uncharacterized protein n=1 Tax=Gibberella moniliformis (strain M3125 / FGSC 7600) TaxID=334819 RepID=W7M7M0_GIBM7|nr:hypothetical protein FVEG_07637 [Fusarium verticillioides 7600]EWG47568.1 hypothetical protein FVEG_07637 [Fusarium verticillioides 7600]
MELGDIYAWSANRAKTFCTHDPNGLKRPQVVSELKPVGVVDSQGTLIGIRFQNFFGDDTNVIAQSEIGPKFRIYQGPKEGLLPVIESANLDGAPDRVCGINMPVLSKEFMMNLPSDCRKVGMRLREAQRGEPNEYTPIKLRKGDSERAVIIAPGNPKPGLGWKLNNMPNLILEEVSAGRSSAKLVRMLLAAESTPMECVLS